MNAICNRHNQCPVFTEAIATDKPAETYRQEYCYSNASECKRFQVAQACGKCPEKVMPNSFLAVDEIIREMYKKGLLNPANA